MAHPLIQQLVDEQQARVAWRVDRDHLAEEWGDEYDAVGTQSVGFDEVVKGRKLTRFRLYDDDGVLYYSGVLYDDPDCEAQEAVLMWGRYYAGATEVKVWVPGKGGGWTQVIG